MIVKPYFKCLYNNACTLMVYVDNCSFMCKNGVITTIYALDETNCKYSYLVDADGGSHLISDMHAASIEELVLNATLMNCLFGVDDDLAKAIAPAIDTLKTRNEVERMCKQLDKMKKIAAEVIMQTDDIMSEE